MNNNSNPVQIREAWVLCFCLGVVMLNYPFVHIFNKSSFFFGIPVLILYFFLGWPISILVIYFFSKTLGDEPDRGQNEGKSRDDEG